MSYDGPYQISILYVNVLISSLTSVCSVKVSHTIDSVAQYIEFYDLWCWPSFSDAHTQGFSHNTRLSISARFMSWGSYLLSSSKRVCVCVQMDMKFAFLLNYFYNKLSIAIKVGTFQEHLIVVNWTRYILSSNIIKFWYKYIERQNRSYEALLYN